MFVCWKELNKGSKSCMAKLWPTVISGMLVLLHQLESHGDTRVRIVFILSSPFFVKVVMTIQAPWPVPYISRTSAWCIWTYHCSEDHFNRCMTNKHFTNEMLVLAQHFRCICSFCLCLCWGFFCSENKLTFMCSQLDRDTVKFQWLACCHVWTRMFFHVIIRTHIQGACKSHEWLVCKCN